MIDISKANSLQSNKISILVSVEDEVRRDLILQILSNRGYAADTLKDIRHITEKLKNKNYNLLIIDITGFNKDPCPFIQKIRKKYPTVSIITLVDRRFMYTYSGRFELLTDNLLINPLNPIELLDAVDKIVQTDNHTAFTPSYNSNGKSNKRLLSNKRKIIAIGGGKGGVGKSIVTANLAAGLAAAGKQVIAVDVHLGGPNLHTSFGIKKLKYGLFNFLLRKDISLHDIVCPTKIERVRLIGITDDYPGAANIKHSQKVRLINNLKQLDADYILLDLGSGTTYNVVDFFSLSEIGIIISSPEITSILNTYSFIKSVLYRKMERTFRLKGKDNLLKICKKAADPENEMRIKQTYELERELMKADPDAERMISDTKKHVRPGLILNMAQKPGDRKIGDSIKDITKRYLNVDLKYLGAISRDAAVEASAVNMFPFLLNSPSSSASYCLKAIVPKIISYGLYF